MSVSGAYITTDLVPRWRFTDEERTGDRMDLSAQSVQMDLLTVK